MRFLPLVLAGLWRKPARTIFAFLSITVAFVLFGILAGIDGGFSHIIDTSRLDRMMVNPRFQDNLPYAYGAKIASVPGVTTVAPTAGLFGYYKNKEDHIFAMMTDANFFAAGPEILVSKQQVDLLLHTRTGVLVGTKAAKKYGLKAGDKLTLNTSMPQQNGKVAWTLDVLGTFDNSVMPGEMNFVIGNYKYLDEARVRNRGTVDQFTIRIKDPARAAEIGRAIDALFINSPYATRSITERADNVSGLGSLGDVRVLTHSIVAAVLFMLLFLTGNTMMQSVRERIPEFGVLKTLGFSGVGVLALVFTEAVLLCAAAGATGLMIVKLGFPLVKQIQPDLSALLLLHWSALGMGFFCALLVAFISGLLPALRVQRLRAVDALAGR